MVEHSPYGWIHRAPTDGHVGSFESVTRITLCASKSTGYISGGVVAEPKGMRTCHLDPYF